MPTRPDLLPHASPDARAHPHRVGDGPVARRVLIGLACLATLLFLLAPIALIFTQAFSQGIGGYVGNVTTSDTLHAAGLTLMTAAIVVPINMLFGIAAAWALTRFRFKGRGLLTVIIELPYSVSPIVGGVMYLFLYGNQGLFGPWLGEHGIRLMFTPTAIVLVTLFVTSPFVARELLPLMQAQGIDEEEAAVSLGAGFWRTMLQVTLPNVKWALLYGAILCTARAIGEFGGVSVVSGNVRGQTNTLPLHIELLYNDYNATGAFAAATMLTLLALLTIAAKTFLERRRHA
jgi:sulfate transport system permease protein